jgi:hypothetical protein
LIIFVAAIVSVVDVVAVYSINIYLTETMDLEIINALSGMAVQQ